MFSFVTAGARRWMQAAAAAIGLAAFTLPAAAQSVTLTSADKTQVSALGEVIRYTFTINSGTYVLNSLQSLTMNAPVSNIQCTGFPLAANSTTTCTADHAVDAIDIGLGFVNQIAAGTYVLRDQNNTILGGTVAGSNIQTPVVAVTPSASISVSPASVAEDGATNLTYTITLSSPAGAAGVTVGYTISGTATNGTDTNNVTTSRFISSGFSTATITVNPTADVTVEPDETFTITLNSGSGYTVGAPNSATGTILNDDAAVTPAASIAVSPANVSEDGATNLTYTVTLDQPAPSNLSINFTTGGTATPGPDYASLTNPLVITAGSSSGTITVDPTVENFVENDETVIITLNSGSGYTVGSPPSATGTILNDDVPSITISNASTLEGNSGQATLGFTVSLSQPPITPVTVDYSSADGTATQPSDYTSVSGTLTFAAGEQTKTISVPVNGDTNFEPNETMFVNLTSATNGIISDNQGQGTITNDDAAPSLSIADVSANEGNSGVTNFDFTVSLNAPAPAGGTTFDIATANGTAVQPGDYTTKSLTAQTIPAGATQYSFTVQVNGDIVLEPNENFFVNVTNVTNAVVADGQGQGMIVNDDPVVTITPAGLALPGGQAGAAYSQQLTATGATAPYSWAVTALALPDGLTLNPSTGLISGTPTSVGTFAFNVTATASDGTGTKGYTITVAAPTLTPSPAASTNLGTGRIGQPFTANVSASGGTAPYSYAIDVNPPGLSINPTTGVITGSPTAAGTYNFSVTMTDSTTGTGSPFSITVPYAVTILDNVTVTSGSPLPGGQAGVAYSQTLTAAGGNGPAYTFSVTGGALPAGLTLSPAGVLSGTPTAVGPTSFTVTAQDPGGFTGSKVLALNIGAPTITVTPNSLSNATVASAYSQVLTASGGTAPYAFNVSAGALPPGMSLSGGVLSGTPTAGGTFNFTVTAFDSTTGSGSPYAGNRSYTLTVNAPTLAMTPAAGALPGGQQAVAYPATSFVATGGTGPYTYSVFSGALPTGLTLDPSTGQLSGTPTVFGAFSFAIRATDSSTGTGPYSVTNAYTLNIQQALPTIASVAPNNGTTAGGTVVTITGTNFINVSSVTFGGTAATSFTVVNATTITATTPARAAGAVNVAVTTPGGTATLTNGYTYVAPGSFQFVVNSGDDDGSFVFSVPAASNLTATVTTSGGSGASPVFTVQPGSYPTTFTVPDGFGLAGGSCSPSTSTVNTTAKTIALTVVSNVTTVCTIEALGSRRATTEIIGAALDASSRLIIANAPSLSRRLDRLNGNGGGEGSASAFGKTFASNLPFSATIGADQIRFSASLSGIRRLANESHTFTAPNENGVPASLAASMTPGASVAATAAADATAAMTHRSGPRFDVWVEGLLAEFDAAANSEGSFAILHAGADYLVTDNLLVGVGIQGDWLDMDTASGNVNSSGWLAGPYATARLSERLYLDARIAWGGASIEVSPFGTYTDTVTSDRELYSAALIGEFTVSSTLTIRPEGRVTWYKETTDAYVDSLNVFIPEVEIKTGEVSFGPDFEWELKRENGGVFMPRIGFDLIWTFQQDNTATSFTGAPGLDDTGLRGRIEAGASYIDPRGIEFGGGLFYDGIGGGDYSAWGGTLKFRFGF